MEAGNVKRYTEDGSKEPMDGETDVSEEGVFSAGADIRDREQEPSTPGERLERHRIGRDVRRMIADSGARNPAFLEAVIADRIFGDGVPEEGLADAVREELALLRKTDGYLFVPTPREEPTVLLSDYGVSAGGYAPDGDGFVPARRASGISYAPMSAVDPDKLSDEAYYRMLAGNRKK